MITGSISINDYLQAQRLHRRSVAKWLNIAAVVTTVCGVVMLTAGARPFGLMVLFAGAGALIFEYLCAYVYLPRKVAKTLTQQKDLAGQFTYSWSAEHIESQSNIGSSRRPWNHYIKVKEDEHIFLLYHTDNLFEMLPKPWFRSAEAIHEFRRLAFHR